MANTPEVSNPNDFKVVTFTNKEDFDFTPELGCMYDSRPIFGTSGEACLKAGESVVLPYHVANLLARNLAKYTMTKRAPAVDPAGVPTGVPLWNEVSLATLKASYLTDLYTEQKPIAMSETDRLMAKVEELKKFVEQNVKPSDEIVVAPTTSDATQAPSEGYKDKGEVIAELTKRDIKFDARKSKAELEKLLA